ncbi:exonuclease domain-containing protein [Streptomyces platensis]|uniref:3'-5' exonuclease n=1 Tax=Streptomyces platensis TaxID=58346 RepID=UPI0037AC13CB
MHPRPVPEHDLRLGPERWTSHFVAVIDAEPVVCVRPGDAVWPHWSLYRHPHLHPDDYLGTLHPDATPGSPWRIQVTDERHTTFGDAVRSLRRPAQWQRSRDHVITWARSALADSELLIIDVQTTGLHTPYAVQIAATDRHGTLVLDHTINPQAAIDPGATALHKIAAHDVTTAETFGALLPRLTRALQGRRCLAYNMPFDRHVIERELNRHYTRPAAAQRWLRKCRWEDAIVPCTQWRGLWSAKRNAYRYQPLGSQYDALTNCRLLVDRLTAIADSQA